MFDIFRKLLNTTAMISLMFVAACAMAQTDVAEAVLLVEDGRPRAEIVLSADADPSEKIAAEELVEHIRLISDAELLIVVGEPSGGGLPIFIGKAAPASLREWLRSQSDDPSAFALQAGEEGISIAGISPEAVRFGTYELLEQLGVRWYLPGELGRVVPREQTIAVPVQQIVQAPSMELRVLQGIGFSEWSHRQRLGGTPRSTGAHGIPPFDRPAGNKRWMETHPEYFALVNGKRQPSQICVSNPVVLELAVDSLRQRLKRLNVDPGQPYSIGLGPNDEGGYCECDKCKALDGGVHDPLSNAESMTDRYVWFLNQVLEKLEDEYPNLRLVWYVYAWHFFPPEAVVPNRRLIPSFAPISVDRIRSMDNPMSPDRAIFKEVLDGWGKYEFDEMIYRGYYNPLASPQFPITQIDVVSNEIPEFYRRGIRAMRMEVIHQSWAASPVTLYLAARLMWDVQTDVDAVLDEFYLKFYGPAAEQMKKYFETLETYFRDTPSQTGGAYVFMTVFGPEERREIAEILDAAESQVQGGDAGLYGERVWAARQAFTRMCIFLDMLEASHRFDFAEAQQKRLAYIELTDQLADVLLEGEGDRLFEHRLVAAHERSGNRGNFFRRFFELPITSGYERVVAEGELVAGLPDEWDFLIDPTDIGEKAAWYRAGRIGGNWQRLRTTSASWSDQGLHYYKGVAWYRTTVVIPESFEGRPIYLWLGGVDEVAKVWVNGELLGTTREPKEGLPGVPGTFRPVDFLATGAVRFGEENTVTIRATNERLDELGTGGIVAPVMFWSPLDPAWRPAAN